VTIILGMWLVLKPLVEAAKEKVSFDMKKLFKEVPYEIQVSAIQKLQDHFEHLVNAWVGKDGRLTVFIDDLDRCPQENVIEVLETLKLFATTEGCVYVLGADHEVVVRTVHSKYKDFPGASGEGIRYLEKIVQVPFTLPIIEITDIRKYVQSFNVDWPHEGCLDIFVEGLPPNPRQIKRAINVFFLLWQLARHRQDRLSGYVAHLRLAKIVALQTVYPDVFEKLKYAPYLLKAMEDHCLKSPDEQREAIKNELLPSILHDAVKIPTLQKLFTIHKGDPLATFSKLEPHELSIFFSLTRSVQLSDTTVKGKVIASSRDVEVSGDIVLGDRIVHISAPSDFGFSSLHQLPSPPRDFTGREEELETIMTNITNGATVISFSGLGGVGKTALALKVAEQLSDRYPDAQFYLDLRGTSPQPMLPSEAMTHVIRAYYPIVRLPESETELRALYQSVLHNQRAILLLDNAAGSKQTEPLIPPPDCLLILTSSRHFILPGMHGLKLDTLPLEDARELLLKIEPRIGEMSDELARLCDYLPLALRVAASAMAVRKDWNPSEYIERLKDAKTRLELIEASFSLSFELLSSDTQKKWLSLAIFPDAFDDNAVAAAWEIDVGAVQEVMSDLFAYSLIEYDVFTSRHRLNTLARLFADARLSDDDRAALKKRHSAYFKTVLASADDLYLQGGESLTRGLALFDLEWRNIEEGHAWAEMLAQQDEEAARLCVEYPIAGAYTLELRLHPRERIRWLEASVSAARRLKDRVSESVSLGNLGLAYAALGETRKAIEFYEQHLTIARVIGDRRSEGNSLFNMSLSLDKLGERAKAVECAEAALKIYEEIESPYAQKAREWLAELRNEKDRETSG